MRVSRRRCIKIVGSLGRGVFYADGSALRLTVANADGSCAVTGTTTSGTTEEDSHAWREWLSENEPNIVVSEIGLTDLRRVADPLGADAREAVREIVSRIQVVRIPDQAMPVATLAETSLGPFAAIHLGVAVAEPAIDVVVTYDRDLARMARMYSLEVITPGRPDAWWE